MLRRTSSTNFIQISLEFTLFGNQSSRKAFVARLKALVPGVFKIYRCIQKEVPFCCNSFIIQWISINSGSDLEQYVLQTVTTPALSSDPVLDGIWKAQSLGLFDITEGCRFNSRSVACNWAFLLKRSLRGIQIRSFIRSLHTCGFYGVHVNRTKKNPKMPNTWHKTT